MQTTPLLSWDDIHVGACAWPDSGGKIPCDVPGGIELRAEPATVGGPLFEPDRPWETGMPGWGQVMEDEGRYRLWYTQRINGEEILCYAASDDGHAWRKPELGLVDFMGSRANNVVYHGPGAAHSCVMKDPSAPERTRYRCMSFKSWWEGAPGEIIDNDEGHRRLDVRNAAKPGEEVLPVSLQGVMVGMNSPDGLRWTPLEEPILREWHDTHNICVFDPNRGKIVGYFRAGYGGRRAISYAETDDFAHWPATRVIHHHVAGDEPSESLYSNCFTFYPDNPAIRLMFPGIYHQASDAVYGQLAVSRDGLCWSRLCRQVSIPSGKPGSPTEGHVYPEPELLRFRSDGRFRLLCRAGRRYHNEWYNPTLREASEGGMYCWAEWPEDRLAGAHAPDDGSFTIAVQKCGDRLVANYRTAPDGWVRFELVDRLVWPPQPWPGMEGFTFDDVDVRSGDETHAPVTWNGSPDLSALRDRAVGIRVRLHRATLFAVTMYGVDEPLVREDPRFPV